MALTKTTTGAINQMMAVDGTTAVLDAIHNLAFTKTGTPTTAALLGSTAPVISAAAYTSCKIPTATIGLTAGMPLTIMCVVNTTWAGGSGAVSSLFDANDVANQFLRVWNYLDTLYWQVGNKYATKALNAGNWAAGVNHVVMGTVTGTTANLYLDGVAGTAGTGITRETLLNANTFIGTDTSSLQPLNGAILCAIWGRVLSAGEITALSAPATWASVIDLPQITVTGLSAGNAVEVRNATGDLKSNAVESGGVATVTYTLD